MASIYTQEVKIPGRKAFGFSYHSRLFVSAVEEGGAAADWLLPGDEIVQVRRCTLQRVQLQTSFRSSFFILPSSSYFCSFNSPLLPFFPLFFSFFLSFLLTSHFSLPSTPNLSSPPIIPPLPHSQVMGKSSANMKPSHLKQILKSCKGGVAMTIHRSVEQQLQCGKKMQDNSPTASSSELSREGSSKRSSDSSRLKPLSELSQSYQAPGTPGSTMSESSAGYHSSHSIPSVFSTTVSPVGPEIKTGQTNVTMSLGRDSPRIPSASSHSQHSGYETDQTTFDSSSLLPYRTSSSGSTSLPRSGYYSRHTPGSLYSQKPTIPTLPVSQVRPRTTSLSGYTSTQAGPISPRADSFVRYGFPRSSLPRQSLQGAQHTRRNPPQTFSLSVDHLESDYFSPTAPGSRMGQSESHDTSHGSHVTTPTLPAYPRQAFSMSNMRATGNSKLTNV